MSAAFDRLPLNALRVFEAVATQLSFAEAAERLHVTPAAVSMQIKSLEDYLQVPLFRRGPRSIELTAAGAHLLPSVRAALDELRRGVQRLRADRAGGPLQVSMLASFLQRWLVSRLPSFQRLHPEVDLRVHTSSDLVDFGTTDFHVAIRFGRGQWLNLHCEKLLDEWLLPVGAPNLVRRLGPVNSAEGLAQYNLLHSEDEPWSLWTEKEGSDRGAARGIALDDSAALLSAAEHGNGLVLARWSLVASAIEQGRLAVASTRSVPYELGYYFFCPESYLMMSKVARFRDWLFSEVKNFAPPAGART